MTSHRVALIGLGMAHKPHLASLRDLAAEGRVEIAACHAPSAERRQAFAAQNSDLRVEADLEAILGDDTIDLALVLTPPWTHLDLVRRLATAGKHVLLEKPVEATVERARAAVEAMDGAGRRFGIMLQHRFRPGSLHLAGLVRDGSLGELVSGSASIRWWRSPEYYAQPGRGMMERDGGGVLLTQAIHTLDLFGSLTGPIASVSAVAATSPGRGIDTEDTVGAGVVFANGAVGTIDATTAAYPGFSERIELACTNATAVLAADRLEIFWRDGRHELREGGQGGGGGADPMAFSHEAHKALIADMLGAIADGREPAVSGREALNVHRLIEALLRSAREGRRVELGS